MTDFQAVADLCRPHIETICQQLLPGGKRRGREYVCGSLAGGSGDSCSVNLETGKWADFAGDQSGGDVISLVAAIQGTNNGKAAAFLTLRFGSVPAPSKPAKKPTGAWVAAPLPENPPPLPTSYSGAPVTAVWPYHYADGTIAGYAVRSETPEGKQVTPLIWARNESTGADAWKFQAMPEPRPLFNLPQLMAKADAPVLIVEGEKTAAAAAAILSHHGWTVTTWAGGSKAVKKAFWGPLEHRQVVIWPDADEPGRKAAEAIRELLPQARIVQLPDTLPDGWDLADPLPDGWTVETILAMLQSPAEDDAPPETPETPETVKPFACLGFDGADFFFLPVNGGQVLSFTAPEMNEANLITLAPWDWWVDNFPRLDKDGVPTGGVSWSQARCQLVSDCRDRGLYNPESVRGVGCWLEGSRVVIHTGNGLLVNGQRLPLTASSSHVYERGRTLEEDVEVDPLSDAAAVRLVTLCKNISFGSPMSGLLLAGWCYIAPICGALHWRPHIWLTGKPGTGKSWVTENVINRCVGKFSIQFRGGSTGPGIRQRIGHNALPSIGDDIESDVGAAAAVQAIVSFARNCSSPGEAKVLKGTADQSGTAFSATSMFCCNSVNTPMMEAADRTRWTVLELFRNSTDAFNEIKRIAAETTLDPLWCAGLRVRARRDAAILAENARRFAVAVARMTGEQRSGDQIGTLLAGAYGLAKSGIISPESAAAWVAGQSWEGAKIDPDEAPEKACLERLLDAKVRLETDPACERTIAEALGAVQKDGQTGLGVLADEALQRVGVRLVGDVLSVACSHPFLSAAYRGTRWEHGTWSQDLIRLPGPEGERRTMVRLAGQSKKCVKLCY